MKHVNTIQYLLACYPETKLSKDTLIAYCRELEELDVKFVEQRAKYIVRSSRTFPAICDFFTGTEYLENPQVEQIVKP